MNRFLTGLALGILALSAYAQETIKIEEAEANSLNVRVVGLKL